MLSIGIKSELEAHITFPVILDIDVEMFSKAQELAQLVTDSRTFMSQIAKAKTARLSESLHISGSPDQRVDLVRESRLTQSLGPFQSEP